MMQLSRLLRLLLVVNGSISVVSSFSGRHGRLTRTISNIDHHNNVLRMTGGAATTSNIEEIEDIKKDYTGAAAALFGNIRIPAALFAGASVGSAFAMPLAAGSEGLKLGLVKRLYALLMLAAVSSQVVAVVVSTLAVAALNTRGVSATINVKALIEQDYNLEWIAARWHLLSGVLFFLVGIGFRAWVTIGCPVIAKAALGMITSATLLCMAFIQDSELSEGGLLGGMWSLPVRYVKLLVQRFQRKGSSLFAIALAVATVTSLYTVCKVPHIVNWLSK
jgi:hypothetical protein